MDKTNTTDLTKPHCEFHDGINYKSIELGTIFVTMTSSTKTEIGDEIYDHSKLGRMDDMLCSNINFKLRFDPNAYGTGKIPIGRSRRDLNFLSNGA